MTTCSYPTRPMNSIRDRRASIRCGNIEPNGPTSNDELTQILNKLFINDLLELKEIEKSNQPFSIEPKFQDYYRWKRRSTSINKITMYVIDEVIKEREEAKEEEPSPYNEVTEDGMINNKSFIDNNSISDDDEEEFDPTADNVAFQELANQELDNATATKTALNKYADEYIPSYGFGKLSCGGSTTLGPVPEDEAAETGSRPEIQCNGSNIPHSPSNSSLASLASLTSSVSSNTNGGVLSPSVITQPPSITNSPSPTMPSTPPTPSTPMVDINSYYQTLQQLPTPSYWQNALVTGNPNMPPTPTNYVNVPAMLSTTTPLAYPVIVVLPTAPQPVAMSMPNNILFSPPQTTVSSPMMNQFNSNNNSMTKPVPTQATEQKEEQTFNYNQNNNTQVYERQFAAATTKKFQAKFNNHAKGNFYISKEKISEMMVTAVEQFDTEEKDDEKLAFGHYKESVAMSINDGQIDAIFETKDGKLMIIINIDLHFKSNPLDVMYLVAMENEEQYRDRVRWCIKHFMSAHEIYHKYGITKNDLPKSSRNMRWFKKGIDRAPVGFNRDQVQKIVRNTHFKTLPKKTSKRAAKKNEKPVYRSRISQQRLKAFVEESLLDDVTFPIVPVVVIKGKNQCIEWKRFVEIEDDDGYPQCVGISLKFYECNKQWRIECMDYDSGRVYYQHRLASLPTDSVHHYSYNQVYRCITTAMLDIYDENRSNNHNRRHYYKNNKNNYNNYNYKHRSY